MAGDPMSKGYSIDLRERVVAIVESGESAREAARLLDLGASTAIRWIARWTTTGSVAAKPGTGHTRSPLELHRQWLIDLVGAEPDLTLMEIRTRLAREKKLRAGTTSIWRFYERHAITFKKTPARRRAGST
jgi:transposase